MKCLYKNIILLPILILITFSAFAQLHRTNNQSKSKQNSVEIRNCPLIDSILDFAKTKLGCAYRSGGTGPIAFDCSGFTYYTFGQFGIKLGRSSRDQILMGQKVDRDEIRPGDLVFWYRGKGYVGHAGLVVSVDSARNFTFIHSSTHGKGVRYDKSTSKWYASTYAGARRIINCDEQGLSYMIKAEETLKDTTIQRTTPSAKPSTQASKTIYHHIKNGETLSTIARKYHVSVNQIKQWNHLKSDMIHAGAKLKIIRR